jgi:lipoate---protein ligase
VEAVPGARQLNGFVPVGRWRAPAAELHESITVHGRRARWLEVERPALVLGSAQPASSVDTAAAQRLGVDVVRRRSGGGGVLLWPGEHLWLDVEVPREDLLWDDDVGRAMHWLGDVWAAALGSLGVAATVHRGGLRRTTWSAVVCFAALGSGEVHAGGAKVVGISQRRTREGARLQSLCHLRWRPDVYAELLMGPRGDELAGCAKVVQVPAGEVETAIEASLART